MSLAIQEDATEAASPPLARFAGRLLLPVTFGIATRDLVTLVRTGGFGWRIPGRGTAVEIAIELVVVVTAALCCRRLALLPGIASWFAFGTAYCLFQIPLGVFDPLSDGALPAGITAQDLAVTAFSAVVWYGAGRLWRTGRGGTEMKAHRR